MIEQIEQVLQEALAAIGAADTPEALNAVRIQYLGKKGSIAHVHMLSAHH